MDYQDLYNQLINEARSENRAKGRGIYYEAHHIVPKCLGGEGTVQQWRTHPNIILLTAREHFLAHYYLTQIYPDNSKLVFAFWAMCNLNNNQQLRSPQDVEGYSLLYEEVKEKCALLISQRTAPMKGRSRPDIKGKPRFNRGVPNPAHSARMKGRKRSPEVVARAALSNQKKVNQYTTAGVFVASWNSINEAAAHIQRHPSAISACLSGKQKSAGGYIWKYN